MKKASASNLNPTPTYATMTNIVVHTAWQINVAKEPVKKYAERRKVPDCRSFLSIGLSVCVRITLLKIGLKPLWAKTSFTQPSKLCSELVYR